MLDGAYQWFWRQRTHYPHNADVWDLRFHWGTLKRELIEQLRSGCYRFRLQQRSTFADGKPIQLWTAEDAPVLTHPGGVLFHPGADQAIQDRRDPALRARCGRRAHRGVSGSLVAMGAGRRA